MQFSENNSNRRDFILNELGDCMLSQKNMDNSLKLMIAYNNRNSDDSKNVTLNNNNIGSKDVFFCDKQPLQEPILQAKPNNTLYTPNKTDSLFWCFYIIKYGFEKYNMIDNQHFIIERNEKIAAIEVLREKKDLLKNHKIKSLNTIESDLTNSSAISISTFFSLAIIYGLNVAYIKKNAYYEFVVNLLSDDDADSVHIIKPSVGSNKYSYELEQSQEQVLHYRENYYKMLSIEKPIQAMTAYKLDELLELSKQLGIEINMPTTKKPTKKQLYDAIESTFS
jgi:hypothetical protein